MSLSGQESVVKQFPQKEEHKERFAQQKLESVQTMDELILAIEETGKFRGSLQTYSAEEVLHSIAILISQLEDLKAMNQLPVCDLTEFTSALGLRKAIARAFISSGYKVNPEVLAESEPSSAS